MLRALFRDDDGDEKSHMMEMPEGGDALPSCVRSARGGEGFGGRRRDELDESCPLASLRLHIAHPDAYHADLLISVGYLRLHAAGIAIRNALNPLSNSSTPAPPRHVVVREIEVLEGRNRGQGGCDRRAPLVSSAVAAYVELQQLPRAAAVREHAAELEAAGRAKPVLAHVQVGQRRHLSERRPHPLDELRVDRAPAQIERVQSLAARELGGEEGEHVDRQGSAAQRPLLLHLSPSTTAEESRTAAEIDATSHSDWPSARARPLKLVSSRLLWSALAIAVSPAGVKALFRRSKDVSDVDAATADASSTLSSSPMLMLARLR
eukprot:1374481-Rhodomonas_salina.3